MTNCWVVAKTTGADQNLVRFRSGAKRRRQHSAGAQQHHTVFRLLRGAAAKSVVSAQSVSLQSESSKLVPANRGASLGRTTPSTVRLPALVGHQHSANTVVYVKHAEPVLPNVVVATTGTDSVTRYSRFGKFVIFFCGSG